MNREQRAIVCLGNYGLETGEGDMGRISKRIALGILGTAFIVAAPSAPRASAIVQPSPVAVAWLYWFHPPSQPCPTFAFDPNNEESRKKAYESCVADPASKEAAMCEESHGREMPDCSAPPTPQTVWAPKVLPR